MSRDERRLGNRDERRLGRRTPQNLATEKTNGELRIRLRPCSRTLRSRLHNLDDVLSRILPKKDFTQWSGNIPRDCALDSGSRRS